MTDRWSVHHAEVLDALAGMENNSFSGCLTDVPYGLGSKQPTAKELIAYLSGAELDTGGDFMGAGWSVPSVKVWRELLRVLRPGAHVLSFAGSRTGDLVSLGMRAAGFEVRDTLQWLYAEAMPKSLDLAKALDKEAGLWRVRAKGVASANDAMGGPNYNRTDKGSPITEEAQHWDGFGSGLKPCYEPVILARKPLDGRLIDNIRKWGCGSLSIDACRIEYVDDQDKAAAAAAAQRACLDQNENRSVYGRFEDGPASLPGFLAKQDLGRWPPNVLIDELAAEMLDAHSGERKSGIAVTRNGGGGRVFEGITDSGFKGYADAPRPDTGYTDSGGASRFFFCAKVSKEERDRGCGHLPIRSAGETVGRDENDAGIKSGRAGAGRTSGARNYGPCVKPISLDRWLGTLIKPPPHRDGTPRRLINLYSGTGSELAGALLAGWDEVVGIEREPRPSVPDSPDYISILRARVHLAATNPRAFEPFANRKADKVAEGQVSLFGSRT